MQVTVRYFAGARAAAGTEQETMDLPEGAGLGELVPALGVRHGNGLARVLAACSFLVDARSAAPHGPPLAPGAVVDVLPPFAGG